VTVHIEDGRHFLQTSRKRFDLITGEPPPPAAAGVVNLYTIEYFQLMRNRLRDGGIATYWLPIYQLTPAEAKSITGAFCEAFPDCTLWEGNKGNWILLGTQGTARMMSEPEIRRPWETPGFRETLREIGVEQAEQLAATFLADSRWLRNWAAEVPPLVDNWPHRAPRWGVSEGIDPEFLDLFYGARGRFEKSAWIAARWPKSFRELALGSFGSHRHAREALVRVGRDEFSPIEALHDVLQNTELETLPLWLMSTDVDRQRIAKERAAQGVETPELLYELALGALASRDYEKAALLLSRLPQQETAPRQNALRLYALCMAGDVESARREARSFSNNMAVPEGFWAFTERTFGLKSPVLGGLPF